MREVQIWAELSTNPNRFEWLSSHPNICQFIDANVGPKGVQLPNGLMTGNGNDDPEGNYYVLCEYCNGGTLVNYLMKHQCRLSES